LSTPFRLQIPRDLYDEMIAHAFSELPNECCGLLAAPDGCSGGAAEEGCVKKDNELPVVRAIRLYKLVNALASPVEFLSEPRSMLDAVRDMHPRGIDIVAIYHSHPTSEPVPSPKDLDRNYSPDVMNLIISLKGDRPVVWAWWLAELRYQDAAFEVV
jgi:proteasome lid subunit RPN8/RPN11